MDITGREDGEERDEEAQGEGMKEMTAEDPYRVSKRWRK